MISLLSPGVAPTDPKVELINIAKGAPHGGFADACNNSLSYVPLPAIKTDQLCNSTGLSKESVMCVFLSMFEYGIYFVSLMSSTSHCSGGQSPAAAISLGGECCKVGGWGVFRSRRLLPGENKCLGCPGLTEQKNRARSLHCPHRGTACTGTPLPYPLKDIRPLPTAVPPQLLAAEGASYYWLFRNLLNFELWAPCAATNENRLPTLTTPGTPISTNATKNWMVPPGWTVHSTIWQLDGTLASGLFWPFATVMYKGDSVVIFIRCALRLAAS